jgi:hypothetical protein
MRKPLPARHCQLSTSTWHSLSKRHSGLTPAFVGEPTNSTVVVRMPPGWTVNNLAGIDSGTSVFFNATRMSGLPLFDIFGLRREAVSGVFVTGLGRGDAELVEIDGFDDADTQSAVRMLFRDQVVVIESMRHVMAGKMGQ